MTSVTVQGGGDFRSPINVAITGIDLDGDGLYNRVDLDSDNDGITDNVEAQATAGYAAPSGTGAGITDADLDGLDDAYDATIAVLDGSSGAFHRDTSAGLTPVNTDGTDNVDYLDYYFDNDGITDIDEAGDGITQAAIDATGDTDGDGLKDIVEGANSYDGFDVNDENIDGSGDFLLSGAGETVLADGSDAVAGVQDLLFRADHTPIIDLNSNATPGDTNRDWTATFTEGDSPVAVTDTDADVRDWNEADLVTLSIQVSGTNQDGASEVISFGGVSLPYGTAASGTVTFGATTFAYDYDGDQALDFTDNAGPGATFDDADLEALIRAITYSNTSQDPTAGDRTFDFQVTDANGNASNTATSTITVAAVNDPPVDGDETNSVTEDTSLVVPVGTGLLANASDVDGGALSVTGYTIAGITGTQSVGSTVTIPGVGGIQINADGSYTFAPVTNYTGAIPVITYTVSDGNGGTDTSTLTLSMVPVNDPPVDGDETNSVTEDTSLVVPVGTGLLANASDVDGDTLSVTGYTIAGIAGTQSVGSVVTIPGVGVVQINADGSYNFAPIANYTGAIPVITYTVSDGNGGTDTSTLTLSMVAVNDPPVDGDETNSVTEDTSLVVPVGTGLLANASDVDGGALSVTGYTIAGITGTQSVGSTVTIPGVGGIQINADGSYTFAPVTNYTGAIPVITYTVSDGNGGTDTSTLTLSMVPVNDPPVDGDETNSVTEDTSLVVPVGTGLLANASDVDGDTLSVTGYTIAGITGTQSVGSVVTIPGVGVVQINADGSDNFAPIANYTGAIPVITYTVSDGNGGTDTSTLTLTMVPVNDDFTDADESFTLAEDSGTLSNTVLAGTSSVDGPVTVADFTVGGTTIPPAPRST